MKKIDIQDPSNEFYKTSINIYKNQLESYKKSIKKFIKSLDKKELILLLKEMKIIKQDYLTNEIKLIEVENDKENKIGDKK